MVGMPLITEFVPMLFFKNKKTGERFWMFNTHFDHIGEIARKNSAVLILQKIKSLNSQGYPVVLSGDFNMEPSHKGIEEIQKELTDSKEIAARYLVLKELSIILIFIHP